MFLERTFHLHHSYLLLHQPEERSFRRVRFAEKVVVLHFSFTKQVLKTSTKLTLCALVLASGACIKVQNRGGFDTQLAHGESQLLANGHSQALVTFQDIAKNTKDPATRARALVGQAKCHIELSQYSKAQDLLYSARKLHSQGALNFSIVRSLGEVHFQQKEYQIAQRHLREVLNKTQGLERDMVLARLVICSQSNRDYQTAKSYQDAIKNPHHEEIMKLKVLHNRNVVSTKVATWKSKPKPKAQQQKITKPVQPNPITGAWAGQIEPRKNWNASYTRRNVTRMGTPDRITVHHTGSDLFWGTSYWGAASQIKKIQTYHQKNKGWADIGYHYIIDRAGRVWEGRPLRYQGAHAGGPQENRRNIGVVLLGNFTRQRPSEQQVYTLFRFLNTLTQQYRIPPHRVLTHSEVKDTTCPGPLISRMLRNYRNRGMASLNAIPTPAHSPSHHDHDHPHNH